MHVSFVYYSRNSLPVIAESSEDKDAMTVMSESNYCIFKQFSLKIVRTLFGAVISGWWVQTVQRQVKLQIMMVKLHSKTRPFQLL